MQAHAAHKQQALLRRPLEAPLTSINLRQMLGMLVLELPLTENFLTTLEKVAMDGHWRVCTFCWAA